MKKLWKFLLILLFLLIIFYFLITCEVTEEGTQLSETSFNLSEASPSQGFTYPPMVLKETTYMGVDIGYFYMGPIFPSIYSVSIKNKYPTVIICAQPLEEPIYNVKMTTRIQGLSEWQTQTKEIINVRSANPEELCAMFVLPIPTDKLFSYEDKVVPIDLSIIFHTSSGEEHIWSQTETITIASKTDFVFTATIKGGTLLGEVNEQDYRYLLATFVTPRDPEIKNLISEAKELMSDRSFPGYQLGTEESVIQQVCAIYQAIKNRGVSYVSTEVSFVGQQNIRLPSDTLKEKAGNCIDGTLVFASALESIGINPVIVLVPEHAYFGFKLEKDSETYAFLETTLVGSDTCANAIAEGIIKTKEYTNKNELELLINIKTAREAGITPIS